MGIFSNSYKTESFSIAQRMLDDKDFRYSSQYAMQEHIFDKNPLDTSINSNLGELLVEANLASLPSKYTRLYRKAYQNQYIYGLPTSALAISPMRSIRQSIGHYLNAQHTGTVNIRYGFLGYMNLYHLAWMKLLELGYDGKTNMIPTPFVDSYLYNATLQVTQEFLDNYGHVSAIGLGFDYGESYGRVFHETNPSNYIIGSSLELQVQYQYHDGTKVLIDSLMIPLDYTHKEYIQAQYEYDGKQYWFSYEYGSHTIVELEDNLQYEDDVGKYFPRLYLRTRQQDVIEKPIHEDKRKHTDRMFKLLGLSFKDVSKQLKASIGGDYGDVHYLYVHLCANINKNLEDNVIAEYLYRYFERLYEKANPKDITIPNIKEGILQTIADHEYRQDLYFDQITKTSHTGKLQYSDGSWVNKGDYMIKRTKEVHSVFFKGYTHHISYQIDDVRYVTYEVRNLRLRNVMGTREHVIGSASEHLVIPLDISIMPRMTIKERELLFNKCLHIHIDVIKTIKIKWYQKSGFKWLLTAIAIGFGLITKGASLKTLSTLLKGALASIAINIAIDHLTKLAIKLGLSPKAIGIFALVLSIGLAGYFNNWDFSKVFSAENVMKSLNKSFDMYNKSIALNIQKIQAEIRQLTVDYEAKERQIQQIKERMNITGVIPLDLELMTSPITASLQINLGEGIDAFYTMGNMVDVMPITQNMVDLFLYQSTKPPSFNDLMGMYQYG